MSERDTDPIFMEALEWFVRMKDEKVSPDSRQAFAAWIDADPGHVAAYERAQALWDRFEIIKPECERMRNAGLLGRRNVLGGMLAAAVIVPGGYLSLRRDLWADHRTGIGERHSLALPDGSRVELGSLSALSVDFTAQERRLRLHNGQGFFDVAPDPARPFIVDAGLGEVRALGTQFDVKLAGDAVTVAVIEHSVSVDLGIAAPVEVRQGWQVSYGPGHMDPVQHVDMAIAQAWRRDRIVFEDVPLRDVLRELERYRHGRIVMLDDTIGDIPVTAIFETRQANAALRVIADTLPVRVMNPDGLVSIVTRR